MNLQIKLIISFVKSTEMTLSALNVKIMLTKSQLLNQDGNINKTEL